MILSSFRSSEIPWNIRKHQSSSFLPCHIYRPTLYNRFCYSHALSCIFEHEEDSTMWWLITKVYSDRKILGVSLGWITSQILFQEEHKSVGTRIWIWHMLCCWMEKEMTTHSSILGLGNPMTEEPGGLMCMGSQRVRHDWVTNLPPGLGKWPCGRHIDKEAPGQWDELSGKPAVKDVPGGEACCHQGSSFQRGRQPHMALKEQVFVQSH